MTIAFATVAPTFFLAIAVTTVVLTAIAVIVTSTSVVSLTAIATAISISITTAITATIATISARGVVSRTPIPLRWWEVFNFGFRQNSEVRRVELTMDANTPVHSDKFLLLWFLHQ